MIRAVARRLSGCLPPGHFLARLGGDEFAILLPSSIDVQEVAALAEEIQEQVRQPVVHEDHLAFVTVSIGAASFPLDASTADGLIKCADMALYAVKRSGRGTLSFFQRVVETTFDARRSAIERVRHAAGEGLIVPFYQPIIRLRDRSVCGFEALARFVLPDGTVSGAAEFGPALEDAESARTIDERVLKGVINDLRLWQASGFAPGPISLNVSGFSLQQDGYAERLLQLLSSNGVPLASLTVEVLETALFSKGMSRPSTVLGKLREAGITIALDDFGTGFASLLHLRDLPVDRVKIARSFVLDLHGNPRNAAIVKAIVGLASDLGLTPAAEGVDSEETYEFLRSVGCNEGQGFLTGDAKPGSNISPCQGHAPDARQSHLALSAV